MVFVLNNHFWGEIVTIILASIAAFGTLGLFLCQMVIAMKIQDNIEKGRTAERIEMDGKREKEREDNRAFQWEIQKHLDARQDKLLESFHKDREEATKRHEELLRFVAEQIAESNMDNQKYMRTTGRERFKVKVRKI